MALSFSFVLLPSPLAPLGTAYSDSLEPLKTGEAVDLFPSFLIRQWNYWCLEQ